MEPKTLDLRGLKCPEPQKKTQEELEAIREGIIIVFVESPANWNIERFAKKSGLWIESKKHKDYYEIRIVKTPHSKPKKDSILKKIKRFMAQEQSEHGLKDMMLVITRDVLGKDETIGRVLIKAFFETMKVMDDAPAFMFFMNSGVMLTTVDDEITPLLKDLESQGVEIYTCSTCLKYFNLEDRLRVGQVGGIATLTDGMRNFKKIMTI